MKILIGLVETKKTIGGLHTCNIRKIESLSDRVDLHLIAGDSGDINNLHAQGVHWGTLHNLPTLFAKKNDATVNRFTAPGENNDIDDFIDRIAESLVAQCIELVDMAQWEEELGIAIFAAARKAHIPYIFSPVDYRLACGETWLFEKGSRKCTGPDESFKKCSRCMATLRHPLRNPYTEFRAVVKDMFYYLGLTRFLSLYASPERWKNRFNTIMDYVRSSSAIVTLSSFHAKKLKELLAFPYFDFHVIPPSIQKPNENYSPGPERFTSPLKFIWINTPRREWGFYFILDAWKKAGLSPEKAQLHLFTRPGGPYLVRQCGFGSLIDEGRIVERKETVFEHEEEIYKDFAAKICTSLWPENAWDPDPFSLKIPKILSDGAAGEEIIEDGVNGFLFRRGDLESFVKLIHRLINNPHLLEEMAGRYSYTEEYGINAMGNRYFKLYESILSRKA